jgi:hypothetical protein
MLKTQSWARSIVAEADSDRALPPRGHPRKRRQPRCRDCGTAVSFYARRCRSCQSHFGLAAFAAYRDARHATFAATQREHTCEACGRVFLTRRRRGYHDANRFCSRACGLPAAHRLRSLHARTGRAASTMVRQFMRRYQSICIRVRAIMQRSGIPVVVGRQYGLYCRACGTWVTATIKRVLAARRKYCDACQRYRGVRLFGSQSGKWARMARTAFGAGDYEMASAAIALRHCWLLSNGQNADGTKRQ